MASDMVAMPNPNTHTNQIKLAQIIERSEGKRLQRVDDVEQPPENPEKVKVNPHVGPSGGNPVIKPGRRQ